MLKKIPYSLEKGTQIGSYSIVDILGSGGFSIVYLVVNYEGRYFAAKEYMPAGLAMRANNTNNLELISESNKDVFEYGMKQLQQEAKLLLSLKHPSILKVFECFSENNTVYLISEYCKGKTLKKDVLDFPHKYNENEIKRVIYPVLEAVDELHMKGMLHRDIAPDNIIIRENGAPVLIDLGSAIDRTYEIENTDKTTILKPGYAPLEQYSDNGYEGEWSDIYSIGALLYFLVSKKTPVASISRAIKDTNDGLDTASCPEYSDELLSLINKCLLMDARSRPQNLSELKNIINVDSTIHYNPTVKKNIDESEFALDDKRSMRVHSNNKNFDDQNVRLKSSNVKKSRVYSFLKSESNNKRVLFVSFLYMIFVLSYLIFGNSTVSDSIDNYSNDEEVSNVVSESYSNDNDDGRVNDLDLYVEDVEMETVATATESSSDEIAINSYGDVVDSKDIYLTVEVDMDSDLYANSIFIDKLRAGINVVSLSPGKHAIRIVGENKKEKSAEIDLIEGGVEKISFKIGVSPFPKLDVAPVRNASRRPIEQKKKTVTSVGKVKVVAVPWGEIFINNKSFGISPPLKSFNLDSGKYKVEIKNPGFKSFLTTIVVKEGEVVNVRHDF